MDSSAATYLLTVADFKPLNLSWYCDQKVDDEYCREIAKIFVTNKISYEVTELRDDPDYIR